MVEAGILAGRGCIDGKRVRGKLACHRLDDEPGIIAESGKILHGAFAVVSYDHYSKKVKKCVVFLRRQVATIHVMQN